MPRVQSRVPRSDTGVLVGYKVGVLVGLQGRILVGLQGNPSRSLTSSFLVSSFLEVTRGSIPNKPLSIS
jgi:hypothetical protein